VCRIVGRVLGLSPTDWSFVKSVGKLDLTPQECQRHVYISSLAVPAASATASRLIRATTSERQNGQASSRATAL
jgi:hypothetical protein